MKLLIPHTAAADQSLENQISAHQDLVSRVERELRDNGFVTEARVLPADSREAIVRTASEEAADLIVVGSHGRSGIAKLVMGSVASHVVAHAPCSVLVVKTGERRG